MYPPIQLKITTPLFFIAPALVCLGLLPSAQAVVPAPDGGYPGGNTAEGENALFSLTTGFYNTAVGYLSLKSDTTGSFNTAIGAGALHFNTGAQNTATGAAALLSNTTGSNNTAMGESALFFNTTASNNTAIGADTLTKNTTGADNTAIGVDALFNNTDSNNTAIGRAALSSATTGSDNIALGDGAGTNLTTGSHNIYIGNAGVANENNVIRIGEMHGPTFISGITGAPVTGAVVVVNTSGQLGVAPSSEHFKYKIKSMDKTSESILALKPVTFYYVKEIEPKEVPQFGLVAEEVEKVNPDLVVRDKEGKPYSVRYDQVNAMLLNEFLKEHRKVEQMQKQIEALTAGLQKVSAQLEASRSAPQVADSNY